MKQILSFLFVSFCPYMLGAYVPIILMNCGVHGPLAFMNYLGYSVVWVGIHNMMEGE